MAVPSNVIDKTVAMVKLNLGRPVDTTLDDYIIEWMNWSSRKVQNVLNFWFMNTSDTISYTSGDGIEALPSDFKDEDAIWRYDSTNGTYERLDIMDIEDQRMEYSDTETGQPTHYRIDSDNNLIVRPVPDDSYTIRVDYWAYLSDMVASGTASKLLTNYPEVVESGSTYRGYRYLGEWEDAKYWEDAFKKDIADLKAANIDRELPDEMVLRPRPDVKGTGITKIKGRLG